MPKAKTVLDKKGRKRSELYLSKVRPHFNEILKALRRGHSEAQIAEELGVSYTSWNRWKVNYSEFGACLKRGHEFKVDNLETTATQRAIGGIEVKEEEIELDCTPDGKEYVKKRKVRIKTLAPSDLMLMFLLKAEKPEKYREKHTLTLDPEEGINITMIPASKKKEMVEELKGIKKENEKCSNVKSSEDSTQKE